MALLVKQQAPSGKILLSAFSIMKAVAVMWRAIMTKYKKCGTPCTESCLTTDESDKRRKQRWKRRLKVRAAIIKKQLQIETRFHKAMREMRTTTDQHRRSYLHWILNQMFSLFDYETGLHAINDQTAYQSWLSANKQSGNK